ncbi:MAG: hypothetical protein LBT51_01780, partial [Fusobacteriaceae bacterium]|nr:hypothetical protein [Fusobacteriaceae bacterium]
APVVIGTILVGGIVYLIVDYNSADEKIRQAIVEMDTGEKLRNIDSDESAIVMNPPERGAGWIVDPLPSEEEKNLIKTPPSPLNPPDGEISNGQLPPSPLDPPGNELGQTPLPSDPLNPPDGEVGDGRLPPSPLNPPEEGSGDGYYVEKDHKIGENGTQTHGSDTIVKTGDGKERVDVENLNPGKQDGSIHYHAPDNTKWQYDIMTGKLVDKDWNPAPPYIQKVLKKDWFQKAIKKGLKILGEQI